MHVSFFGEHHHPPKMHGGLLRVGVWYPTQTHCGFPWGVASLCGVFLFAALTTKTFCARLNTGSILGGIQEKIDFLNSSQNRYFFFVYASAAIYKNYAEVGAYNSSWIKSYEHRSKFIFISARPS